MKDFIKNIDEIDPKNVNISEAEKISFDYKINALQGLVFERFRSLTIIATVCLAVIGISLSFANEFINNYCLATISFVLILFVVFISLGRYLFLIRSDITAITRRINQMSKLKWLDYLNWAKENQNKNGFKLDYWPESLYALLIVSVILFFFSIIFKK